MIFIILIGKGCFKADIILMGKGSFVVFLFHSFFDMSIYFGGLVYIGGGGV